MENTKKLNFSEQNSMHDRHNFMSMRGMVRISDETTGEVLLQKKKNIIVYRGRTFALEKIFDSQLDPNINPNFKRNLDRKVCLFTVGNGGAPVADPFSPFVPEAGDSNLASPIPFITIDTQVPTSNPNVDLSKYHNPSSTSDGRFINYFSKEFDNVPEWKTKSDMVGILESSGALDSNADIIEDNEIFKYIVLRISTKDCRDSEINELGLQIAHKNDDGTYSDIELFSRITFPTEPIKTDTKKLLVEYFVYA